jgi:hypothetical protein
MHRSIDFQKSSRSNSAREETVDGRATLLNRYIVVYFVMTYITLDTKSQDASARHGSRWSLAVDGACRKTASARKG